MHLVLGRLRARPDGHPVDVHVRGAGGHPGDGVRHILGRERLRHPPVDGRGGVLVAAILLGWIPPLIWIITFRLSIEFVIAIIRTSQNTSELVDRR